MNDLLWKKFPILNDGFICLSDVMGNDSKIASRARTSYGKDTREPRMIECPDCSKDWGHGGCGTCYGQEKVSNPNYGQDEKKDIDLIRRLMRDRHTSPFEFCTVEFLVRAPIYVFRQWHRHRTASINEYSGRYKEMIDSMEVTNPDKWRLQSKSNKQGSSGYLEEWPEEARYDYDPDNDHSTLCFKDDCSLTELDYKGELNPGLVLTKHEEDLHYHAQQIYKQRLMFGVAKEQACKDLPVSNYSEMYWSCNLHNLLHFLTLRMDSHAQEEIRLYANQIGEIVKQLFPVTWQAFEDYRLNAMTLTALDIKAMQNIITMDAPEPKSTYKDRQQYILEEVFTNKTERQECVNKLTKLGIL